MEYPWPFHKLICTEQEVDRSAEVVKGVSHSNIFGAKAVLHEIDKYLLVWAEESGIM